MISVVRRWNERADGRLIGIPAVLSTWKRADTPLNSWIDPSMTLRLAITQCHVQTPRLACSLTINYESDQPDSPNISMDTHIMPSIFDTRLCASPFFPCFINRFVNRSNIGSTFGGSASSSYPLTVAAARSGVCAEGLVPSIALTLFGVDAGAACGWPFIARMIEANVAWLVTRSLGAEDGGASGALEVGEGVGSGRRSREEDANERIGKERREREVDGTRERMTAMVAAI